METADTSDSAFFLFSFNFGVLLPAPNNDEFHVKVTQYLDEACKLLEVGFKYVTEIDGARVFRKRK